MSRKKMSSAILDANGGLDSERALAHARNVLLNHDLKQPVLYHLVLTGSQLIPVYQATIKSLIRRIRSRCRLEYFGAYENDEEKGLHAHIYILIETSKKPPFALFSVGKGKYLDKLAVRHGLNPIHISKPKSRVHEGEFFARPVAGEKLEDCLKWIEYPFKKRSKDGIPAREKYFSSEFKSNVAKRAIQKQRYLSPAAPTAAEEAIIESKEIENETKSETQTSASSEAGANFPDGKFVPPSQSQASPEASSTGREAVVHARPSAGSGEAQCEASPSIEAQRYSDSGATANFKGTEMRLTAAQQFLASVYEEAVDQGLDVDAMRRYLLERGIKRTPLQVEDELQNTFGFYGYAASHPPRPVMSVKAWDRAVDNGVVTLLA